MRSALKGNDYTFHYWLPARSAAVLCADNLAVESVEAMPAAQGTQRLPLQQHWLVRPDVPLGEFPFLKELVRFLRSGQRNRFMLTARPPWHGGFPITPVANV